MSDYLTEEEFSRYQRELKQRKKGRFLIFGGLLVSLGLIVLLPEQAKIIVVLPAIALFFIAVFQYFNILYFRQCPKCGGKFDPYTNICKQCGVSLYRVGKKSDGSEWLQ